MSLQPAVSDASSQGRPTGCDASCLPASECRSRGLPGWYVSTQSAHAAMEMQRRHGTLQCTAAAWKQQVLTA
jgi:hypothetical protein